MGGWPFSLSLQRQFDSWQGKELTEDSGAYNQSVGSKRPGAERGETESASASLPVQLS
jgi:hypothetical protein